MNDSKSPPPLPGAAPGRRRWIMALSAIGLFFVVCFVVAVAFAYFKLYSYEREIAAAKADLAAQGFPTTLVELDEESRPLPEEENGAVAYLKVIEALEAIDPDGQRSSDLADTLDNYDHIDDYPPEEAAALRALCGDGAPVFDALAEASKHSNARFPVDLTLGMQVELPHLSRLRHLARFLKVATANAFVAGEWNVAIERHTQILAAAATLRAEPVLISQLVRGAIDGIASDSLESLLSNAELDDGQLADLSRAYEAALVPESYRRVIGTEWCTATATVHGLIDGSFDAEDPQAIEGMEHLKRMPGIVISFFIAREEARLHREFAELLPAESPHWPAIAARSAESSREDYGGTVFAAILLPAINRSGLAFVRDVAYLRMPQVALAVERYRLGHGVLPDSLMDCVPEFIDAVPEDPYDGAPLRYQKRGEGYILYSVFEDLDDDNGTPFVRSEGGSVRDGDLVFTVTR